MHERHAANRALKASAIADQLTLAGKTADEVEAMSRDVLNELTLDLGYDEGPSDETYSLILNIMRRRELPIDPVVKARVEKLLEQPKDPFLGLVGTDYSF